MDDYRFGNGELRGLTRPSGNVAPHIKTESFWNSSLRECFDKVGNTEQAKCVENLLRAVEAQKQTPSIVVHVAVINHENKQTQT